MKTLHTLKMIVLAAAMASLAMATHAQSDFVAHEWGTFTSVQGGDGELLPWYPLKTSELPPFVHVGLIPKSGPHGPVALQRMETPVIYFYAANNLNVDVGVDFPKGIITEWYPQMSSAVPLAQNHAAWKNLKLVASPNANPELEAQLPQSKSGTRYFAAREPNSAFVQMGPPGRTNMVTETEKFIFYRGVGSFPTPLRTGVDVNNSVTVKNNGDEKIARLFLVSIHEKQGAFASMDGLPSQKSVTWQSLDPGGMRPLPLEQFQAELALEMKTALVQEGLFPKEAQAMVDTWRDSWFAEDGDRVLYLLPRSWTDETLPLTLDPKPATLVRVMVGRAEILGPKEEQHLLDSLVRASDHGGTNEREVADRELKSFGRFAEPALRLAKMENVSTNALMLGYQLLFAPQPESQPAPRPSPFE
jgi:hypothetical protein